MAQVGYDAFRNMLLGAAARIRDQHELLSKLDSVGGDGDHGTTMLRAMANLEQAAHVADPPLDGVGVLEDLLRDVGWAIMGVDGGATGPLFGMLFMSMADAVAGRDVLDAPALASAFEAGLEGVRQQTKAQPGDKTLIDALAPAVAALREAAAAGAQAGEALRQGADAARRGAEATKAMQARFGRAKNVGKDTIGSQDPGATSVALMFEGFCDGLEASP